MRLPHPRTDAPSLYLSCKKSPGVNEVTTFILEVQSISPHSKRSWFLKNDRVISDGKLLFMTPVDPVFLLIPILRAAQPVDGTLGKFRPIDDIFEESTLKLCAQERFSFVKSADLSQFTALDCVHDALKRMCEYQDLTDELTVYRYSRVKLLQYLSSKVAHLAQPVVFETYPSLQRHLAKDGLLDQEREALRQAGRLRVACEIVSQYLPPDLHQELIASYEYAALDEYLRKLAEETSVLTSARSAGNAKEATDDKKRKAVAQLSKGVSKLMKVNTSGMAKISSFFKKTVK
ncbi:ribonuclease H2, subunit B [Hysterangium stoloniferum]|nr:ribonuclease H2, subunit B [Hysterangium stoloniferum]